MQPSPHKDVKPEITSVFGAKKINLDALFDGANPFEETDGPTKPQEEDGSAGGF